MIPTATPTPVPGSFETGLLCKAVMNTFGGEDYLATGVSYGFASVLETDEHVYVATKYRVYPTFNPGDRLSRRAPGEVMLGDIGAVRDLEPLTRENIGRDAKIMICVLRGPRGLFGRWCLKSEWESVLALRELAYKAYVDQITLDQQQIEKREAELKKRNLVDPPTIEIGKQNGWFVTSSTEKQTIMHRDIGNGKKASKTFYHPPAKATRVKKGSYLGDRAPTVVVRPDAIRRVLEPQCA